MTPYYEDDLVTLYHGDARDILPCIATDAADCVITDPPYGMSYVTNHRRADDPLRSPVQGDEDLNALRDVMPQLDRVLANNRHAYLFAGSTMLAPTLDTVSATWTVKNTLIWDKGDAGSVGDLEAGYAVTWEAIIYASKGRRKLNGPRPRAIYRYDWTGTRDPVHPTVKPVGLLSWLMAKSTGPGELVIDPFAGSGTTLRSAKDLGRRAIGVELDERYCEIAVDRLRQESLDFGGAA